MTADDYYLYICDQNNNRIRRLSLTTATITTYAGIGSSGYDGTSGQATSGKLERPYSICITSSYIYAACLPTSTIFRITLSNQYMEVLAGGGTPGYVDGLGTNSRFNYPYGMHTLNGGIIWIADSSNNRIRQYQSSNNIVTTIAGSSSTGGYNGDGEALSINLNQPRAVTGDVYYLWMCDLSNNRVRRISLHNSGYVLGDPHFKSASGGTFSITGTPEFIYDILTEHRFQWNCQFISRRGEKKSGTNLGKCGFIVNGHKILMDPSSKSFIHNNISIIIKDNHKLSLDSNSWIRYVPWKMITVYLYSCYQITLFRTAKVSITRITNPNRNRFSKNPNPDYIFSRKYRWHFDVTIRLISNKCVSHGLFGQTTNFYTKVASLGLNGEGVIQGKLSDYVVSSLLRTDDVFSMYKNIGL
eukprot:NODE_2612_length_1536_cov_32.002123_g2252_i0.p1 GENE.NODE_2612_length_1536_cov_32.002123_g2252_i0~~NODE_2612_length_1536_cov_32.002123_g2252_i0.p1  ORF type:complete len:476 (-),score=56.56 NODE_2612_length_1536_cov_32.002123_g2252_i0:108-1349(-)